MILCSRRALVLAAALAPLAVAGLWLPAAPGVVLAGDLLLALLVVADALAAPRVPAPARSAPGRFSVGRETEVEYAWTNPGGRRARLRVRELRPELLGGLLPPRMLTLAAREVTRERLSVRPARRGRETSGRFAVDVTGPLGLGVRRRTLPHPWAVVVYPPLVAARLRASLADARRREPGERRQPVRGEGRLFESLREWVPGDDPRFIDWKATARRRKPIARQFEAERRQQVMLVLDAGRLMTADVGGVPRMEYAVAALVELAAAAARFDDNVGLMVFADGVKQFVPPRRGRAALAPVLDALAAAEPALVEPDYPGAFRFLAARSRKRALTVVVSDVIDRLASEALVAHLASLRPRHLPLAVTLRDPALDALAAARPADTTAAFRRAAAEELVASRDDALAHMRAAGVLVLDVPPARAAEAVVRRYVDLKRRGRL